MPRILPRLNAQIKKQADHPKNFPFPKHRRRKSLYRLLPPTPSFHPADHPTSILLAPANPITNSWDYKRHKTLPPATTPPSSSDSRQTDSPREMTSEEFQWWSNPYLRMLASPLRKCIVTDRTLPSDFLLRLVAMRVPASRLVSGTEPKGLLVPDGLLHSKYTHRKAGRASYILCWREAVLKLQKGSFKRISPHVTCSPRLLDYIAHLLRLRVLQEFELLAERLEYRVKTLKRPKASSVILRRLTRVEWGLMRSSGFIPYQNALAVLIVPPVNKDVVTGCRPEGSMSVAPPAEVDDRAKPATRPLSVLMPTSQKMGYGLVPQAISSPVVPLYNGATAFPNRFQRSALYSILVRILVSERVIKKRVWDADASSPRNEGVDLAKASHAFLLCSDETTGKRGDVAGIARALWRLRMFEGEGWQHSGSIL